MYEYELIKEWGEWDNLGLARNGHMYAVNPKKFYFLKSPDRIVFVISEHLRGIRNGKEWFRWREIASLSISTRRAGRVNVYLKNRVKQAHRAKNGAFISTHKYMFRDLSPRLNDAVKGFIAILRTSSENRSIAGWAEASRQTEMLILKKTSEMLGEQFTSVEELYRHIYPMLEILKASSVPNGHGRHLRTTDYLGYIKKTFREIYRKDLVKAALDSDTPLVALYYADFIARSGYPVDWAITAIKNNNLVELEDVKFRPASDLAVIEKAFGPNRLRRLIEGRQPNMAYYIWDDVIRLTQDIQKHNYDFKQIKVTTLFDLHETLSKLNIKLGKPLANIPQTDIAKMVAGIESVYDYRPAENNHQLMEWSELMSNCISSYERAAIRGDSVLVGVYDNGELLANLEMHPGSTEKEQLRLTQMLGKRNKPLTLEQQDVIVEDLKKIGLSKYDNAWGYTSRSEETVMH